MTNTQLENYTYRFFRYKAVKEVLGEGFSPSMKQIERLHRLFISEGGLPGIKNMVKTVAHFIDNDLTNYTGRYRRLKEYKDGTSRYTTLLRYGPNKYNTLYEEQTSRKTSHFTNRKEYWIKKGYSITDAEEKVREIQIERNKKAVLLSKGTSLYTVRSIEYWLARGYTEEESRNEVRRIQTTNGLEFYKKKYGEDIAEEMLKERIDKWQTSMHDNNDMDEVNFKKGHSIEAGLARGLTYDEAEAQYEKIKHHLRNLNKSYSKIAVKFCDMMKEYLNDGCYFMHSPHEYKIGNYRVDFYHKPTKTVVEFYGDYWHRNPEKYVAEDVHTRSGKLASEIWENDRKREEDIKNSTKVNNMFIVWESDFRKNPQDVVENIIKEINYGRT